MRQSILRMLCAALALMGLPSLAPAQSPPWMTPERLAAARAEGGVTVYSSVNETEG